MGYGGQRIICDNAEPKSIVELQEEGIKAEPSRKGKDSVNHGIQLIQNYQIVVQPQCVEFKKEIETAGVVLLHFQEYAAVRFIQPFITFPCGSFYKGIFIRCIKEQDTVFVRVQEVQRKVKQQP